MQERNGSSPIQGTTLIPPLVHWAYGDNPVTAVCGSPVKTFHEARRAEARTGGATRMALKPCLDCGRITTGSRCPSCRRASPYQQPAWRQLSEFVVRRDGSCRECGSTHYLAAHHVIPRNKGGADHPANLIALCASCHGRVEAGRRSLGSTR